jgi:hypothetical protein
MDDKTKENKSKKSSLTEKMLDEIKNTKQVSESKHSIHLLSCLYREIVTEVCGEVLKTDKKTMILWLSRTKFESETRQKKLTTHLLSKIDPSSILSNTKVSMRFKGGSIIQFYACNEEVPRGISADFAVIDSPNVISSSMEWCLVLGFVPYMILLYQNEDKDFIDTFYNKVKDTTNIEKLEVEINSTEASQSELPKWA